MTAVCVNGSGAWTGRNLILDEGLTLSAALFSISTGTVLPTTPEVIVHIAFAVSGKAEQGCG